MTTEDLKIGDVFYYQGTDKVYRLQSFSKSKIYCVVLKGESRTFNNKEEKDSSLKIGATFSNIFKSEVTLLIKNNKLNRKLYKNKIREEIQGYLLLNTQ